MAKLSKACKPDNEPYNSLKLSFTNIPGYHSNLADSESFLEWNSPDILVLRETNLDGSMDSGDFFVRGYLPLIWKDSSTHMHSLTVNVKEGLPFAQDLSLENTADSSLCFQLILLHSVPYFFFLYRSPSSSSNVHHKDQLTILVELIDLVNSVIILISQMTLLRWLTFLLRYQTVILTVLHFLIYFFRLTLVFVLQWLSFHWEILITLCQFPFTFYHIHNGMPRFIPLLMTILVLIGWSSWSFERCSMGGYL